MRKYQVFQQGRPQAIGENVWDVYLRHVGDVMAESGSEAIEYAKQMKEFKKQRGLARFPLVQCVAS